jgi:putative transposase
MEQALRLDHFQEELHFLGIRSPPSFIRDPEGNGYAERFIRLLKENLLWVKFFATNRRAATSTDRF